MGSTNTVHSLAEFVAEVRRIREDWRIPDDKELWFRGEKRDYGETRLRPVLYRPPPKRTLRPIADLLKVEDDLFETFQRCNVQLTDTVTDDDFDGYFLMQHHGGPTRLLDWSDGSLMALHFSLRDKRGDETDSLVYVLDPTRLMDALDAEPDTAIREEAWKEHLKTHPLDADSDSADIYLPPSDGSERTFDLPRIPMVLSFAHITRRVAAQRSQFIVFGADPLWLSNEASKSESSIRTITIDGKRAKSMKADLRECGVTESVIFPDLDGLGRELKQVWEDRQ